MSSLAGNPKMRLASRNDQVTLEQDMIRLWAVQWPFTIAQLGDDMGSGASHFELLFNTRAEAEAFRTALQAKYNLYPKIIERPYLKPELSRPRAA